MSSSPRVFYNHSRHTLEINNLKAPIDVLTFDGVEGLMRRARLPVSAIRKLADADAFRSLCLDRRAALWEAKALRDAPDLPLFQPGQDEGVEPLARLPQMPLCEQVVFVGGCATVACA